MQSIFVILVSLYFWGERILISTKISMLWFTDTQTTMRIITNMWIYGNQISWINLAFYLRHEASCKLERKVVNVKNWFPSSLRFIHILLPIFLYWSLTLVLNVIKELESNALLQKINYYGICKKWYSRFYEYFLFSYSYVIYKSIL